jgi:hypothetical protein
MFGVMAGVALDNGDTNKVDSDKNNNLFFMVNPQINFHVEQLKIWEVHRINKAPS